MNRKAVLLIVSTALLVVSTCTAQSLVINEIGYDLPQSGLEFIELLNTASSSIDLSGLEISDARGQPVHLQSVGLVLPSGAYIVLTSDRNAFRAAYGLTDVVEVRPWPALNNDGDVVVIRLNDIVADSVFYHPSWGGTKVSLERRDPARPSLDPSNWGSSTHASGATPGRQNSLFAPDRKAPRVIQAEETAEGIVTLAFDEPIRTSGARFTLNGATPTESPELRGAAFILRFSNVQGMVRISSVADLAGNVLADTNVAIARLARSGDVVVNEIMYEPVADPFDNRPDGSEYVEVLSVRDEPVGLTGWYVTTRPTETGKSDTLRVEHGPKAVVAGGFFVFDTGGRSLLRNDGDEVVLHRADGTEIDRVAYTPDWHNPVVRTTRGVSIERISSAVSSSDPGNWTSCVAPSGGTPGAPNSVLLTTTDNPPASRIQVAPSPFSPDHDGFDDVTVVSYTLRALPIAIRARIFDVGGRLVRSLAGLELSSQEGTLVWDGLDDRGRPLPIGIYIVLLEASAAGGAREAYRSTVVLARQL